VEDVRALPPQQTDELDEAEQISPWADRAPDVLERDEPDARFRRCIAERPRTMGCNGDVEAAGKGWKKRGDVRLSAADLGKRDQQQDPGSPRAQLRPSRAVMP
jgi:hypothetical protein